MDDLRPRRSDAGRTLALCHQIAQKYNLIQKDWCGFNVLQLAASRIAGLDLGLVPNKNGKNTEGILQAASLGTIQAVYLLGADEIDTSALKNTFVIYQGHHGDRGAAVADIILPSTAYTEKSGLYVNVEGRPQLTQQACPAKGEALDDWKIITQIGEKMGLWKAFEDIFTLREALFKEYPHFSKIGKVPPQHFEIFLDHIQMAKSFENKPFKNAVENFYQTNVIARHSTTMAKCAKTFLEQSEGIR